MSQSSTGSLDTASANSTGDISAQNIKGNKGAFYITTALPYLNADPHIGHALELVQADIVARYKKIAGFDVVFNTGTDEHGEKIFQKAAENNLSPQEYVDSIVTKFKDLKNGLNLSFTNFIRTTDPNHIEAAKAFWKKCLDNGDIYKGTQEIKYCVGCELEKHESDLVDEKCPIHQNLEIQTIKEENYFFNQSKYQAQLLEMYEKNPEFVVPAGRFNEIKAFVERELRDFSISRIKEKMPWGIPVPGDDDHVMYVWFDALVNYIATLGWPEDEENFKKYWPGIQVAGKDNLRQQSAMWQTMLMSAGLPTSKQIFIHGFITSGGQKMSKSLGNVINPFDIIATYGVDAFRYYITREMSPYEDGDFTIERFKEAYNANLANGIGNLTSRIMKMAVSYDVSFEGVENEASAIFDTLAPDIDAFNFSEAANIVWKHIADLDARIQIEAPFKKIKSEVASEKEAAMESITKMLQTLFQIAYALGPFLPKTSEKIIDLIRNKEFPEESLFARVD